MFQVDHVAMKPSNTANPEHIDDPLVFTSIPKIHGIYQGQKGQVEGSKNFAATCPFCPCHEGERFVT
jgi:hypothetical protein